MYASTLPRSNWLRRASIRLAWYRHMPSSSFKLRSCILGYMILMRDLFAIAKFLVLHSLFTKRPLLKAHGMLRPVYSDATQLDVELSWVELCRYKRAFTYAACCRCRNVETRLCPIRTCIRRSSGRFRPRSKCPSLSSLYWNASPGHVLPPSSATGDLLS